MARFLRLHNNVVTNAEEWLVRDAPSELIRSDTGGIGDTYDPQTRLFTRPAAPPPAVPNSVSMRQARLALLGAGLLSAVQAAVDASPEAVQIEWEFASDVWRRRDLVQGLAAQLGLNDAQVDGLFIVAATIP